MGLLRHLEYCNRFDARRFRPLQFRGKRIGWVRDDNAALLARFPEIFVVDDKTVTLTARGGFDDVSDAVDRVVEALVADGAVSKWRNESFGVTPVWGDPPLFKIDRGAVPLLGVRAYGVHLNGWRRDPAGRIQLWIGRRAPDKKVDPDKLDNLVAGGIGYRMEWSTGARDDTLYIYDLETPADFTPHPHDGEIVAFMLMDAAEVLDRVDRTDDFKFNVNLVIIDFALRHGLIPPAHPEYAALKQGLRP